MNPEGLPQATTEAQRVQRLVTATTAQIRDVFVAFNGHHDEEEVVSTN